MSDASLDDFGANASVDPPLVKRKLIIQSPHTGKIAGFIGQERRRGTTAYTALRRGPHFYRNKKAYAISDSILDRLEEAGAVRIYIHEGTEETDEDVYEFTVRQYREDGKSVPAHHLYDEMDPQTYVPLVDYQHKWPGHSSGLFMQSFSRAVENMNPPWRGYDPELKEKLNGGDR